MNALADILRLSPPNQKALTALVVTPLIPPLVPSSIETYAAAEASPRDERRDSSDHPREGEESPSSPRPSDAKWRRGKPLPAVVATVSLAVNGDGTPGREGLRVRAAAAGLFEVLSMFRGSESRKESTDGLYSLQSYVANSTETQLAILSTMAAPQPEENPNAEPPSRFLSAPSDLLPS